MSDASAHEPGGECRCCPVCLALQALQEVRPDVRAHLVAAGRELVLALQAVLASSAHRASDVSSDDERGTSSDDAADNERDPSSDVTMETWEARRLRRIDIQ